MYIDLDKLKIALIYNVKCEHNNIGSLYINTWSCPSGLMCL